MAEDRARFATLLEKLGDPPARLAGVHHRRGRRGASPTRSGTRCSSAPPTCSAGRRCGSSTASQDLARFLAEAARLSPEHPVVLTKFVEGADEVELDAISDGKKVLVGRYPRARRAGGHPLRGRDLLLAARRHIPAPVQDALIDAAPGELARALHIRGPFNVQFLVKDAALPDHRAQPSGQPLAPVPHESDGGPAPPRGCPGDARAGLSTRTGLAPAPPGPVGCQGPAVLLPPDHRLRPAPRRRDAVAPGRSPASGRRSPTPS